MLVGKLLRRTLYVGSHLCHRAPSLTSRSSFQVKSRVNSDTIPIRNLSEAAFYVADGDARVISRDVDFLVIKPQFRIGIPGQVKLTIHAVHIRVDITDPHLAAPIDKARA